MRRLIIYTDGTKSVIEGLTMQISSNRLVSEEIDLDHLTDEEFEKLYNNPTEYEYNKETGKVEKVL